MSSKTRTKINFDSPQLNVTELDSMEAAATYVTNEQLSVNPWTQEQRLKSKSKPKQGKTTKSASQNKNNSSSATGAQGVRSQLITGTETVPLDTLDNPKIGEVIQNEGVAHSNFEESEKNVSKRGS